MKPITKKEMKELKNVATNKEELRKIGYDNSCNYLQQIVDGPAGKEGPSQYEYDKNGNIRYVTTCHFGVISKYDKVLHQYVYKENLETGFKVWNYFDLSGQLVRSKDNRGNEAINRYHDNKLCNTVINGYDVINEERDINNTLLFSTHLKEDADGAIHMIHCMGGEIMG